MNARVRDLLPGDEVTLGRDSAVFIARTNEPPPHATEPRLRPRRRLARSTGGSVTEPPAEQTPMDRLREIGLLPADVPREKLREILAEAVQEVQERLAALEDDRRTQQTRRSRRRPRERP